jgi:hypothetical protein
MMKTKVCVLPYYFGLCFESNFWDEVDTYSLRNPTFHTWHSAWGDGYSQCQDMSSRFRKWEMECHTELSKAGAKIGKIYWEM